MTITQFIHQHSKKWAALCASAAMMATCAAVTGTAVADEPSSPMTISILGDTDSDMTFRSTATPYSDDEDKQEQEPVSSLGVTLGSGVTAVVNAKLNQKDVYAKALKAVISWRKDALSDTRIKFKYNGKYVTVAEYLKNTGISTAEYLAPKWSNALERIATQRAVEAIDYNEGHTRPNGESCFTARYGEDGSFGEILAWTSGDITTAIDLWASEKNAYINEVNGKEYGVTGHYTTLIDPGYTRYGFGQEGTTFAGEASGDSAMSDLSESPTNWTGTKQVEVNLSGDKINQGITSNIGSPMAIGQAGQGALKLAYRPDRYSLKGTWASSDPSVITVTAGGYVTVKKIGTAKLTVTVNGAELFKDVTVHAFVDTHDKTPHITDIDWLFQSGISTGWPQKDGTYTFRGTSSVTRQDMAAFLYRLAGSPAFDAASAKNPFTDVNAKTPHYKEILWLASTGITTGWTEKDGSKTFRGMSTVKRQDMAAFLRRLATYMKLDPTPGKSVTFRDVNTATPHTDDIAWLASTGVTTGWKEKDGSYTFRGMNAVVRQDMAAFLHRLASLK